MLVAKQKRKENIIEYLLYMYQIEDTIRAVDMNFDVLNEKVISRYNVQDREKEELNKWYRQLMLQMKDDGVEKSGHMIFLQQLANEVNDLHLWLLKQEDLKVYKNEYEKAKPLLLEFQQKIKTSYQTEIDIALNALYYYVLMKMKSHQVHSETKSATGLISGFLKNLAHYFRQYEEGNIRIS